MSAKLEEMSAKRDSENQCGVILGYWDHEKTPTLIQDLEQSVNSIEKKCKNLLQELIYYKKYLEESEKPEFYLAVFKKCKKSKNSQYLSGSDPDIAFRKNLISFQETQQIFEEKFQEKLVNINEDLRVAGQKLGLKDSIILFPTEDYLKMLWRQTEHKAQSSWSEVRDWFVKLNRFRAKTKSDSIIADIENSEQCAKITKNELELYQKLSRLTLKRGRRRTRSAERKMIAIKGKKVKLCWRKKSSRFFHDLRASNIKQKQLDSLQRKPEKRRKKMNSASNLELKPQVTQAAAETAVHNKSGREEAGVPLRTIVSKAVPFTTCMSTSKSYNLGLNIQGLLSISKREGKTLVRTVVPEQNQRTAKTMEKRETLMWTPELNSEEMRQVEEGGNVWVSKKGTLSNFRKMRSKYTGSSPEGFMEYHKSTMSQYTNGQKSMIKSESKSAYAVGSKIMVSGCQRTDVFEIDKDGNSFKRPSACGDGDYNGKCAKLCSEWTKVYCAFLNTYRRYSLLKKKLSENVLAPSKDELKTLENEIEFAVEKYKDFLQVYSKFLHLKHRLKSLKIACGTKVLGPLTPPVLNTQRRVSSKRPTSSMVMKKAFLEIQALQDKIRLLSG